MNEEESKLPATAATAAAPPEFARQVRGALGSLYDPASLQHHPLGRALAVDGRSLRERLLGAIDALMPNPQVEKSTRAWRRYHLLRARYVEARDPLDVAREIGLSRSQYYREHEQALRQLIALLWDQYSAERATRLAVGSTLPLSAPRPRHSLPHQTTSFVGRQRELAEVKRLIETTRLLTLTGAGGCGKTRLALESAAQLIGAYRDGVCLVELAPVAVPGLVPQTVATALGISEAAGEALEATLIRALAGSRLLLLVDNCEHVVDAAARLVEALLRACPALVVLATSREPLQIAGETVLRVPTLSTPDPTSPPEAQGLRRFDAVGLFLDRAAAAWPGFDLTAENASAIAEICRRLDGIPLAIELAAARVPLLSPQQISERLRDSFQLLTGGSRTALPRHRTLRAMVDWSHELLSEPERAVLRRLSVFAGGWTLEAAEVVCSDSTPHLLARGGTEGVGSEDILDLLGKLVSKSLVTAEAIGPQTIRYRILETFRQYGQEQLEAHGELSGRLEAHARYFLDLAKAGDEGLGGAEQLRWLEQLEAERDNLRVALARCSGDDLPSAARQEIGPELARHLFMYWNVRARLREGAHWLTAMAQLPVTSAVAICHAYAGFFNTLLGNRELGQSLLDRGVELAEQHGDVEARCWARYCRGVALMFGGDAEAAEPHARLAVALSDDGPNEWLRAIARMILGGVLVVRGKVQEATEVLGQAIELSRALGDRQVLGLSLAGLGQLSMLRRDYVLAETQLAESARLLEELGSSQTVRPGNLLALLSLLQGNAEGARARYHRYLALARDAGWQEHAISALAGLAMAEATSRRAESAAQLFGAVAALREGSGASTLPVQRAEEDRQLADVRASLSESEYNASWARGAAMGLDEAAAYALALPVPARSVTSTSPQR